MPDGASYEAEAVSGSIQDPRNTYPDPDNGPVHLNPVANLIEESIAIWEEFLPIDFQKINDMSHSQFLNSWNYDNTSLLRFGVGDVSFSGIDIAGIHHGYYRSDVGFYGEVHLDTSLLSGREATLDLEILHTAMHEIGHHLGLVDIDAIQQSGFDTFKSNQYSIMSYNNDYYYPDAVSSGSSVTTYYLPIYPLTPMLMDLKVLHAERGYNPATRTGDDVYGFNVSDNLIGTNYDFSTLHVPPVMTIYDAGGNDTFDVSGYINNQSISLEPGTYSSIANLENNIAMAFPPEGANEAQFLIENAVGGPNAERITGNNADNHLIGNGGNDTINGKGGNNLLEGGSGQDKYIIEPHPHTTTTIIDDGNGDTITVDGKEIPDGAWNDQLNAYISPTNNFQYTLNGSTLTISDAYAQKIVLQDFSNGDYGISLTGEPSPTAGNPPINTSPEPVPVETPPVEPVSNPTPTETPSSNSTPTPVETPSEPTSTDSSWSSPWGNSNSWASTWAPTSSTGNTETPTSGGFNFDTGAWGASSWTGGNQTTGGASNAWSTVDTNASWGTNTWGAGNANTSDWGGGSSWGANTWGGSTSNTSDWGGSSSWGANSWSPDNSFSNTLWSTGMTGNIDSGTNAFNWQSSTWDTGNTAFSGETSFGQGFIWGDFDAADFTLIS